MAINLKTTDSVELTTDSNADIDVIASWADLVTGDVSPDMTPTAITSAGTNAIVAAPGSGQRRVQAIHACNVDASLTATLTFTVKRSSTSYRWHQVILDPGEEAEYVEGVGWFLVEGTSKLNKLVFVTADSSHVQGAAWGNITGLQAPVTSGRTYVVLAHLYHQTNATTTGAQFGIGGVAMTEMIATGIQGMTHSLTAAAFGTSAPITAVDTAINVEVSINAATTNYLAVLSGYFKPSASGTFSVRAQSEQVASATLTVKKGSWAFIRETDN